MRASASASAQFPELTLSVSCLSRRFVLPGLITLCLYSTAAEAHAILLASTPPAGGKLQSGAAVLQLRFNSRVDPMRSRLTLLRQDHGTTVLKIDPDTDAEVLASHVDLAPGAYTVQWQVLAVDGHITRGEVAFTVSAGR